MPQFDLFIISKVAIMYVCLVVFIVFILLFSIVLVSWIELQTRILFKVMLINETNWIKKFVLSPAISGLTFLYGDLLEQFVLSPGLEKLIILLVAVFLISFLVVFIPVLLEKLVDFVSSVGKDINQGNELSFGKNLINFSAIFVCVLLSNVIGILPFSFTLTSSVVAPFLFSFTIFFVCVYTIISKNKLNAFAGFLPAGTAPAIVPLIVSIELISYLAKFISLGIRLFANMFAGHLLLKVFYSICFQLIASITFFTFFIQVIVITFIFFITLLEIMIAFLQAFVMLLLSILYVKESENFVSTH